MKNAAIELVRVAKALVADDEFSEYDLKQLAFFKKAERAGIRLFHLPSQAKDVGRHAAEMVNGRSKVGYTVYGSEVMQFNESSMSNGYYPMVSYGSGTSKSESAAMVSFLVKNGWKAVNAPDLGGILVGI